MLSGAVLDPRALAELIPDYRDRGAPLEADVHEDRVYFLTPAARSRCRSSRRRSGTTATTSSR